MSAYKDADRGTWYCRFRYTDYTGKRHETTKRGFRTKKEALQYEQDFKSRSGGANDLTMSALCDAYLKDKQVNLKASSYEGTAGIINMHIRPAFGSRTIVSITKLDIRQWQNDMKQKQTQGGSTYAPATLRRINIQLKALFSYAVKYYDLPKNPAVAVDTIGHRQKRQSFWELSDFNKFIAVVDKEEYRLCFLLLFYSGMRIGELRALSVDDFDFETDTINISKSFMQTTGTITTPKTPYSIRKVPMPHALMQEVQEYIGKLYEPPERLFTFSLITIRNRLKKYAQKAGVPLIHIHDLRHSHASHLIHEGVPVTTISRRLGHANASITLSIYSHMYEESAGNVATILENAFAGGQNVVKQTEPLNTNIDISTG